MGFHSGSHFFFPLVVEVLDLKRIEPRLDGSNLKAKQKRLIIVFATLYTAQQGVCRAERTEAIANDYATGATLYLQKTTNLIGLVVFLSKPQA